MGDLNITVWGTVGGSIIVAIILSFNSFVWGKRYMIKSRITGFYERFFSKSEESKYTVGASQYIKEFRKWRSSTNKGISIVVPYFHTDMIYNDVIAIVVYFNNRDSGNIVEILFNKHRCPSYKYFFGVTDDEVKQIARRIYFQDIIVSVNG